LAAGGTAVSDETVYMRTTRKALEAAGGAESLARMLARPLKEVQDWLAGRVVPPDRTFLDLLEIVSRRR
jgi:hypothetical protein